MHLDQLSPIEDYSCCAMGECSGYPGVCPSPLIPLCVCVRVHVTEFYFHGQVLAACFVVH